MDQAPPVAHLVEHLFRHESGKLVSALTRLLGLHNVDLAEEVVQDSLLKALQIWPYRMPEGNPSAWLMRVAKNRAIDVIRRERNRDRFAWILAPEADLVGFIDENISEERIADDQLALIFACCHPSLGHEAQVIITLNLLCGLTAAEIATAFLVKTDTMQKRLYRARQALKQSKRSLEIPSLDVLPERLDTVLAVLYLMFNEGYKTSSGPSLIREDLCFEALRLVALLTEHPRFGHPHVMALSALMHFHAARLRARVGAAGENHLMQDQDRGLWDQQLIARGFRDLARSQKSHRLTRYHLEAGIAAEHCRASSLSNTNWHLIKEHYRLLMDIQDSPFVALNYAIAVFYLDGPAKALTLLEPLESDGKLSGYYLLHTALGEVRSRLGQNKQAVAHYREALRLTLSPRERVTISEKIDTLEC